LERLKPEPALDEADTEMTDPAPPEASPPAPAGRPAVSRWARFLGQLKRFRGPIAAIAGIGAIFSGLVGYWTGYENIHKAVVPTSAPAAVTADAGPLSIVVLPFTNLTGDPNQAYVADGLTASVTADLSRIRDAFIVDAVTAFAYKDKALTAQQVGKDLGVHFVLQGSVQRSGTKIRINAHLADATSNALLWSDTFEGDQSDLFALQDQVTARIATASDARWSSWLPARARAARAVRKQPT
jgi:adenylate cyclase